MGMGITTVLAPRVRRVRVRFGILIPAATLYPSARVTVIPYGYYLDRNGRFNDSSAIVIHHRLADLIIQPLLGTVRHIVMSLNLF
jgi:hypothetical protein